MSARQAAVDTGLIDLIPPDPERCQVEYRSFMTLGPRRHRCANAPVVIAREVAPPHGEISLCESCRQVCVRQMPDRVTFRAVIGPRITGRAFLPVPKYPPPICA